MDWIQILDPSRPQDPIAIDLPDPTHSILTLGADTILLAVGHGLSGVHRYNHHTVAPYTVAAHAIALGLWSVRGFFAQAKCKDPRIGSLYHLHAQEALAHLLHDAAEALGLSDPTAPIKRLIASEAMEQFERRAVYAVMGAVCPLFDPRPSKTRPDPDPAQIERDMDRLFERVKRADTRILLDEYGAFVRFSARKRDALAGVGPLGIPQGPLRALASLSPRAQTLLFAALGLTLRACCLLGPNDFECFVPLLAKQLDDVRHWRGVGTREDAALALIVAEAILCDDSSPQDYDVPQPCCLPPIAFHLRAEPDAMERFAVALADRYAGSQSAADRLASQAMRYGFEWHVLAPHADDDKHGWRVQIEDPSGQRVTFERTKGTKANPARWGNAALGQAEAVARVFGALPPDHFRAVIARAHPLAFEQACLLRLARLLNDPTVQEGQDDKQRAAAIKARAEQIGQSLALFQCRYLVSVWPEALTDGQAWTMLDELSSDFLLYFHPVSDKWCAYAAPGRATASASAVSPHTELAALLLDAEWQVPPIAFRLEP